MDIKKEYSTDSKKEVEGVWVDMDNKTKVLIARVGSKENMRLLRELQKPHTRAINNNSLSTDVLVKMMIELIARTILLGWEGMEEGGDEVPYSYENAKRLLTEYKDFRDNVSAYSNDMTLFRKQEEEAEAKN